MEKRATESGVAWRKHGKNQCALDIAGVTVVMQINAWRATATVAIDGKTYIIKRRGLWKMVVEIFDDAGQVAATFTPQWTGTGTLLLRGRKYNWKFGNWWATAWKWEDVHGREVQRHVATMHWFRTELRVSQSSPMPAGDEAFLAALGWYLQYMNTWDSGSTAAVVTTVS